MDVKTYRAKTMQEALALVRTELGPRACVLRTREVRSSGLLTWLSGAREIEVTASATVSVPSRLPARAAVRAQPPAPAAARVSVAERSDSFDNLEARVADLCRRSLAPKHQELPESLFQLFAQLIDAEVSDELARELVERMRAELPACGADMP